MLLLLILCFLVSEGSCSSSVDWNSWVLKAKTIGNVKDVVSRNFQISAGYYDLGVDFCALLNTSISSGDFGVNWPVVAAWASNTVGISIRKELPTSMFRQILSFLPEALVDLLLKFPEAVAQLFQGLLQKTSLSLAAGNRAVWVEVGTYFALFGAHYGNLTGPDPVVNKVYNQSFCGDAFCQAAKEAMQYYYLALFEGNLYIKQQYVLAANAYVGYAEQARLQPYIAGALISNYTFHFMGLSFTFPTEKLITQLMIGLVFPNEFLDAGHDVPPILGTKNQDFPSVVRNLTLAPVLQAYLQFAPSANSLKGTAASDWISLSQRMRFIAPMFRRSQQDKQLQQCPPFSAKQLQMIRQNTGSETIRIPTDQLCLESNCCPSSSSSSSINIA